MSTSLTSRSSRHRTARVTSAWAATALAAVLLSGCTMSGSGYSGAGGAARLDDAVVVEQQDGLVAPRSADAAEASALIITGDISITTDDPLAAAEEAGLIVTSAGGRVDARSQSAPRDGNAGSAFLTLRIPAAALDEVRAQLGELGRVDVTSLQSVDVGVQQRDLETRIATLRASITRYTGWLATAESTADLIELESAISSRQIDLESLEAQQRGLTDQVAFSTIELQLYSESTTPASSVPDSFGSGLAMGWNAFVGFWVGATVIIGILLPWLAIAAVAAGLVVWLRRRAKARQARLTP